MHHCLELAAEGEGRTSPNPMVGSVVVKDGKIIGEGFHHAPGQPHAEVNAINDVETAGGVANGATIYVNLEPCCHFGRTPPCSQLLIDKKIARVVIGGIDPDARVAGGGIAALEAAGIEVVTGVLAGECRYLNRGFLKAQTEKLPWLSLKMAITLDGRIADRDGKSKYITGTDARKFVMSLRDRYDCILIGANTARLDDPLLNVRDLTDITAENDFACGPLRVVLDPHLSVKPAARLFSSKGDVILFCLPEHIKEQRNYPASCRLIELPADNGLAFCLETLLERGVHKVLCEGGGRLAGSLLRDNLVDELYWFVAPKMMIDEAALPAVASDRPRAIDDAQQWKITTASFIGDDLLMHALAARHEQYLF